ncbi:hypothetical protein ACFLU9_01475 [Chloroflexota bacterium]
MEDLLPELIKAIEGWIGMWPARVLLGVIALAVLVFGVWAIINYGTDISRIVRSWFKKDTSLRVGPDGKVNREQGLASVTLIKAGDKSHVTVDGFEGQSSVPIRLAETSDEANVDMQNMKLKIKPIGQPLEVIVQKVSIGRMLFDEGKEITQFLVQLTLKASGEIQLSKLDLVYEDRPYPALPLPTKLVRNTESYEVEYRVPGSSAQRTIQYGLLEERQAPDSERPQASIHILAGGLDINTHPFPIPTPKNWLVSHKSDSQTE